MSNEQQRKLNLGQQYHEGIESGKKPTELAKELGLAPRTLQRYAKLYRESQKTQTVGQLNGQVTYIYSPKMITLSFVPNDGGEAETTIIYSSDAVFEDVAKLCRDGTDSKSNEWLNYLHKNTIKAIETVSKHIKIDWDKGVIVFGGAKMSTETSLIIFKQYQKYAIKDKKKKLARFTKFVEKLLENPSEHIQNHLWQFMKFNDIKLDDNGNIIAWKKVRDDYYDIHSGTMDNSVGNILEMKREDVDDNPNNTCSHGLHVCAFSYLEHFGRNSGSRIMKVLVDPRDFVSIPVDYGHAKARVCKYKVIAEFKE